jgi:predicted NUDIX family NTP pyrophosphohydrolase
MARTEQDGLRELARQWTREADSMARMAEDERANWNSLERRMLKLRATERRACAIGLKNEMDKVRRA